MEARRDQDQVKRLGAYDRGEARRLARRALDATPGRLEAVLDAHRARKRSWRLLSVGDYDVDADGPVELLPRWSPPAWRHRRDPSRSADLRPSPSPNASRPT